MARAFVWTGGGLFVGSLAVAALTFGLRFGQTQPLTVWPALAIDALLLGIFAFHHSLFARDPVKQALARAIPHHLLRSVYVWVASLLLIAVCLSWQSIGGTLYNVSGWNRTPFVAAELAGVWLIARSVGAIDPLELAGIRSSKGTSIALQNDGVYGLVRHPLYFGWVLIVFGAAHMTGDRLAFAALTTAYLVVAIPWEERSLEQQFGPAYERYRSQVKWRIVPYLY